MRKYLFCFLAVFLISIAAITVFASPDDVVLVPLTRYNYKNIDGYGFYEKCADSSWFGMVFRNDTKNAFTISLPDEVRITGWNGTRHPVTNTRFIKLNYDITNFLGMDRTGTPFSGDLTLPAKSTYAVLFDITGISAYNIYWDTNVYFKIRIGDGNTTLTRNIAGVLAQRGNACSPDAVCSAEVLSGSYHSNGTGDVIVRIKNNMPDSAQVTAYAKVDISWKDSSGGTHTRTVDNAVTWSAQPNWISSGSEKTISGSLSLPVDIAAAADKLSLTFHFHHPSSLFFGDFSGSKELAMVSGLQGVMSGTYEADGSGGLFTAVLNNHQNKEVSVTLPDSGIVKTADGRSHNVFLNWKQNSPVKITSHGKSELSGSFRFAETDYIHNNSSMILAANLKAGNDTGTAAGTITRNPDPNPIIRSISFCRDLNTGNGRITFTYALRNDSFIDIPLQLAGTLALRGQAKNMQITYTACESQGKSCFSRIDGLNFTLEAGETAGFSGYAVPEQIPGDPDFSVRTSLLYYPDGESKALYVGETSSACQSAAPTAKPTEAPTSKPTNAPTAKPTEAPTSKPTDVPTAKPTEAPTSKPTDAPTAKPTEAPTSKPTDVPTAKPTETPTSKPTDAPTTKPTEAPTSKPTDAPTAKPTEVSAPERAILEGSIVSASYSQCKDDPALRIIMIIRNNGTAEGKINLDDLIFKNQEKKISVSYTSCIKMSAGGNSDCLSEAAAGSATILPDVSLRLEGQYLPSSPFSEDQLTVSMQSDMLTPSLMSFTASSVGTCAPLIEPVPDTNGNDISAEISNDGTIVTLSISLVNSGSKDEVIRPGTIYLHQTALNEYQAIVSIEPISPAPAGKEAILVSEGETFILPARSAADISVALNISSTVSNERKANISWNFGIGNSRHNYTGAVLFRQNTDPAKPGGNDVYNLFVPEDVVLPEKLPATGFPTRSVSHPSVKQNQPSYKLLNGLHLEIPAINAGMDVVQISLDDSGEWAVENLDELAGVLDVSALPGNGTSIIAGHNHLDELRTGPFLNLYQLDTNDRIFVTDDSGKFLLYRVYENELVAPDQSDTVYRTAIPGSLVLMTCESEMPEGGYAYRRLVYAEPMQ